MKSKIILTTVLILIIAFNVKAQYSISGIVKAKDSTQNGITVKLSNRQPIITDKQGKFVFTNLSIKKYTISFSGVGFNTFDTTILLNENTQLNIVLKEEKKELEEVVIVASSRTNTRIEDLPTKVEVLGAEELHEENQIKPGNIASILGDIAGVQIQQTTATSGSANLRIQGLQGKYTQILRDGMPLFGGFSGSFGILQVPPLDLQQIELVKGASSTLYGGGAIAGMVNLVSKKPKLYKKDRSITLNISNLKEKNITSFFSARNKKIGYTFYAGGTLQKQVDVDKDGYSDVPNVKNIFIHPRWFLYGKNNSSLAIGYTFNREIRDGGDMNVLNGSTDVNHQFYIKNRSNRNSFDIVWEKKNKDNSFFTAKAATNFFTRKINTNLFSMKAHQTLWYSELAYAKKSKKHNYVVGLNFNGDVFKNQTPSSSTLPNESTNTIGFFAQDDWKLADKLTLQSGLRYDYHSVYNGFLLPRLSLMYKANNHLTMRIGEGLGYKTPSLINSELDERQYPYILGYASNIQPEKSSGFNFDVNYKTKAGDWELTFNQTFFYTNISSPIYLKAQPSVPAQTYYAYENYSKPLQSLGFETFVAAKHDELELYFGYVYTDAKRNYNDVNSNLPLVAKNKIATIIAYEFSSHFRAGIETAYNGKQYLDDGTVKQDYVFAAAMIRYSFNNISIVLNGENLFDFRQNKNEQVVLPPSNNPYFKEIWAPLDGRVINLSVMFKW
jgi:iron complex outermembrane receptor protein/outer membrane receptor for ferrienterochelin and colicins